MKNNIEDFNGISYGDTVALISFYDKEGIPNVTTISSSYTMGDMIVVGFKKDGYAAEQIRRGSDFAFNIPNFDLIKEVDCCGKYSGRDFEKSKTLNIELIESEKIEAPIIKEAQIVLECTPFQVIENEQFEEYMTVIGKIKGHMVKDELVENDGTVKYNDMRFISSVGNLDRRSYNVDKGSKMFAEGKFINSELFE